MASGPTLGRCGGEACAFYPRDERGKKGGGGGGRVWTDVVAEGGGEVPFPSRREEEGCGKNKSWEWGGFWSSRRKNTSETRGGVSE